MILSRSTIDTFSEWYELAKTDGTVALIEKDLTWTSFDVVNFLRKMLHIKKVGHAGTLDPLATGLLIVCFGKGTKRVSEFQDYPKEYVTTMKLGATTVTDDCESPEEIVSDRIVSHDEVLSVIPELLGTQQQIPPDYSAVRINGKRMYELARDKKVFVKAPRIVDIHDLQILDYSYPFVQFRMACSKGTYVRSVARDIGEKLGVGAYVTALHRTKIGQYHSDEAVSLEQISAAKNLQLLPTNQ